MVAVLIARFMMKCALTSIAVRLWVLDVILPEKESREFHELMLTISVSCLLVI